MANKTYRVKNESLLSTFYNVWFDNSDRSDFLCVESDIELLTLEYSDFRSWLKHMGFTFDTHLLPKPALSAKNYVRQRRVLRDRPGAIDFARALIFSNGTPDARKLYF